MRPTWESVQINTLMYLLCICTNALDSLSQGALPCKTGERPQFSMEGAFSETKGGVCG